jgi:hypothetical protein
MAYRKRRSYKTPQITREAVAAIAAQRRRYRALMFSDVMPGDVVRCIVGTSKSLMEGALYVVESGLPQGIIYVHPKDDPETKRFGYSERFVLVDADGKEMEL